MSDIETRYELPTTGITLLGYVVRRMHKTNLLIPVPELIAANKTAEALAKIALYAVTSSTSFGRAYYQPQFNSVGEEISEADPQTGAVVKAKLEANSPTYRISYFAIMPNGDVFSGKEEITGTTVGLRGLGMPAPSKFSFKSGEYSAELTGILTSELALSLIGRTRIRAYGFLNFGDNAGNTGKLNLERSGKVGMKVNNKDFDLSRIPA
ncbi:MAG: hypothetical protein HY865_01325 [Chloroflexi bacterium]|nr:hypothetical protein [Chloroflexota bacterium]